MYGAMAAHKTVTLRCISGLHVPHRHRCMRQNLYRFGTLWSWFLLHSPTGQRHPHLWRPAFDLWSGWLWPGTVAARLCRFLWYLSANGGNRGYKSEPRSPHQCQWLHRRRYGQHLGANPQKKENLTICSGDSVLFSPDLSLWTRQLRIPHRLLRLTCHPRSHRPCPGFYHAAPPNHLRGAIQPSSWTSGGKRRSILRSNSKTNTIAISFITFELRVIDTLLQRTNASVCQGDSLFTNGQWLKDAGISPSTIPPRRLRQHREFTLTPPHFYPHWKYLPLRRWFLTAMGQVVQTTGTYSQAFATQNGCDSTEVYN